MKRVILFRHAKSDWGAGGGADHERPLNARGREAARQMGRFLAVQGQVPERILCSSATRAQETLALASGAGGWKSPVEVTDDLYATSPPAVIEILRAQPDTLSGLLLVGHEPVWSDLASQLVGGGALDFPTAAMARIDLRCSTWDDTGPDRGSLAWLVRPKLLSRLGFEADA